MSTFRLMAIALGQELQARGVDWINRRDCEQILRDVVGRTSAVLNEALSAPPRLRLVIDKGRSRKTPPAE